MSSSNCCFLTCIYVSQEAGQVVWYSHLFQHFPEFIAIHTVKSFGIVNKAEIDVFLELSWFFYDPVDAGNLISGSSAFSKTSLNIWRFILNKYSQIRSINKTKGLNTLEGPLCCCLVAQLRPALLCARQAPLSLGFPTRILEWVAISFSRRSSSNHQIQGSQGWAKTKVRPS